VDKEIKEALNGIQISLEHYRLRLQNPFHKRKLAIQVCHHFAMDRVTMWVHTGKWLANQFKRFMANQGNRHNIREVQSQWHNSISVGQAADLSQPELVVHQLLLRAIMLIMHSQQ
jgi:hypothetical protein